MQRRSFLAGGIAAAALPLASARAATEVSMTYPFPDVFNDTHRQIAQAFAAARSDITLNFRTATRDYEEATQRILRDAVTNQLPDVTFQGLNRVRALVDRNVAVRLDPFIAGEQGFAEAGFNDTMFAAGKVGDRTYGVPFAVSLPIVYFNLDLVARAGGNADRLPDNWDGVLELAARIDALPGEVHGLITDWTITGNWMWQALVMAEGGTMMDAAERRVAFGDEPGKKAMRLLSRMITEGRMPNVSQADMRTAFAAGQCGIMVTSTAYVNGLTRQIGDRFTMRTTVFPSLVEGKSRLPAGGNVAVITARDPARQRAAWEALKFWTGPVGGATMVRTTGYMAANRQVAETELQDFYRQNPNQYTAIRAMPYMAGWYAFPGPNGLKITDVIKDRLQSIVDGSRAAQHEAVLADMVRDVQALLPRAN